MREFIYNREDILDEYNYLLASDYGNEDIEKYFDGKGEEYYDGPGMFPDIFSI